MPAFLNGTGDVSVGDQITNGDDLYIIASGAVTVGTIDTRSDSRVGAVVIVASASNITYRGNPVDGQMEILCTSCSSSAQDYNFETPTAYTADVNVGGNVDGSEVSLAGLNVQVDGHVTGWTDPSGTINADVFFAANAIINIEDDITSYGTVLVETNATEFTVSGDINSQANVEIAIPGSVSIEGDLLAGQSNNGLGNYAEVSAGMQESSPTSPISIGGQVKCPGGSIILTASGTISATDLSVSLPSCLGPQTVQIQANQGQTGSVAAFGVGSSGSNGVSSIENVSDTGCTGVYNQRFIYISNGPGDITIADGSLIDGTGTECQSAMLVIDASKSNTSTISLNGGTLATDGSDTYPGNVLALFAGTISFANTPTISASDGASGGDGTYITLCCNTISYDSVTINCNGENAPRTISLVPPGSQHITVGYEELELGEVNPVDGPLTIEGSGTFSVNANGLYGNPNIFGDPISFNNSGPINITANSQAYPLIFVDTINGGDIYFNGSGPITFNADADIDGGDSGGIYCYCGNFATSNASFTCSANSTNNGANIFLAGGGGWTAPLSLSANCAQGNGGNIQINYIYYFSPSSISITANGGTSDGPGGSVLFNNLGEISLPGSIVANGQGAGAGGQITFESGILNLPVSPMTMNVDALGDGNGGSISFSGNGYFVSGDSSNPATLSAQSLGAGNGGTITLDTNSSGDITLDTISLLVGAGSGGTGGNITLNANNVYCPTSGSLNADGAQGGGQISLNSLAGDIGVGSDGDAISISAQSLSAGNGGTVSINTNSSGNANLSNVSILTTSASETNVGGNITISGNDISISSSTTINADGGTGAGQISLTTQSGDLDIEAGDGDIIISAQATSSGDGGSINLTSAGDVNIDPSNFYVPGKNGKGGTLTFISSGSMNVAGIFQLNGQGGGDGGTVSLLAGQMIYLTGDSEMHADGANGGNISITCDQFNTPFMGTWLLTANGQNGIGGNIKLTTTEGDIPLGSSSGFSCEATGLADTNGNGGIINVSNDQGSITLQNGFNSDLDASAIGNNGLGGSISLKGNTFVNTSSSEAQILAFSAGVNTGGNITFQFVGSVDTSLGNGITLNASASDTGAGGTVQITSGADITLVSGAINVNAGVAGSGAGGNIILQANGSNSTTTINNEIDANGNDDGMGGSITINTYNLVLNSCTLRADGGGGGNSDGGSITINANSLSSPAAVTYMSANGYGTGDGNSILIVTQGSINVGGSETNLNLSATSNGSGNGGSITLDCLGSVSIAGSAINANAGSGGNGLGGSISIPRSNSSVTVIGTLSVNGSGSGDGGSITLVGNTISLHTSELLANGGVSGNGGKIFLTSNGSSNFSLSGMVQCTGGASSGDGGNVSVIAESINIQSTGNIDVSTSVGNGGTITLSTQGFTGDLNINGLVDASGGNFGGKVTFNIAIPTSVFTINNVVTANGTNGNGSIDFSISGNLAVTGSGILSAINGKVTWFNSGGSATFSLSSIYGLIQASGTSVSITVQSGDLTPESIIANGGDITINAINSELIVVTSGRSMGSLVASGSINLTANSMNIALGSVPGNDFLSAQNSISLSIPNSTSAGNLVIGTAINAVTGNVVVNAPSSDLTILPSGQSTGAIVAGNTINFTANSLELAENALIGNDYLSAGQSVTLSTANSSGAGDIVIGSQISCGAGSSINITAYGNANIYTQPDSNGLLNGNSLNLSSQIGNIGYSSNPLQTSNVQTLQANTPVSGGGSIYIENGTTTLIDMTSSQTSGGAFSLESAGQINVGSLQAVLDSSNQNLGISLISDNNSVLVVTNSNVNCTGNILLQGGQSVTVSANSRVAAAGSSGGNLTLSVGAPVRSNLDPNGRPTFEPQPMITNGAVYWGNGLALINPGETVIPVTANGAAPTNPATVVFSGNILLGDSVAVYAST